MTQKETDSTFIQKKDYQMNSLL